MIFDHIELPPCNFCGGPPMLNHNSGEAHVIEHFEAHVSCHECGARGGEAESFDVAVGSATWVKVLYHAVINWIQRDNRNSDLIERDLCQIRISTALGTVTRIRDERDA